MRTSDIVNNMKSAQAVAPAAKTATFNSAALDCQDCGPEVTAILNVGAVTGTTPTLDVTAEESNVSGSGYTAIPGFAMAQVTASTAHEIKRLVNRTKRYVRLVCTIAGTTPSFTMSATLLVDKTSY